MIFKLLLILSLSIMSSYATKFSSGIINNVSSAGVNFPATGNMDTRMQNSRSNFGQSSNFPANPKSIHYESAKTFGNAILKSNSRRIHPVYSTKNEGTFVGKYDDLANIIESEKEFGRKKFLEEFAKKLEDMYPKSPDGTIWKHKNKYNDETVTLGAQETDKKNMKLLAKLYGHYLFDSPLERKKVERIFKDPKNLEKFFDDAVKLLQIIHQCHRLEQSEIEMPMTHIKEILKMKNGDATKLLESMEESYLKENILHILNIDKNEKNGEEMAKKADEILELFSSMREHAQRIANDAGVKYSFQRDQYDKSNQEAKKIVEQIEKGLELVEPAHQILQIWDYFVSNKPKIMEISNSLPTKEKLIEKLREGLKNKLDEDEYVKMDEENVKLVAELLEIYKYYGNAPGYGMVGRREGKFDEIKIESGISLLKGLHVANQVCQYELGAENVEKELKKRGDLNKLAKMPNFLIYVEKNLWPPLGIKNVKENVEEKAKKLLDSILAPKQFASLLANDFEIKYNENKKLSETASNFVQLLQNGYYVVDRIVAILNACDNFRDEKIWDWKNKFNTPITGNLALLQSKQLSEKEAMEIIAEHKEQEREAKDVAQNLGKNSTKDMK